MRIRLALCSLTAAVWLILVSAAQAESLRIGYLTWVGSRAALRRERRRASLPRRGSTSS